MTSSDGYFIEQSKEIIFITRTWIADIEKCISEASGSEAVKLNKELEKLNYQTEELITYEEMIHFLADQMIRINLDDGVKHNYEIFKDVLAKKSEVIMIDVFVTISAIVMCSDESISSVNVGNGYTIKKTLFDDFPFKDNIVDGKGQLSTDYFNSRIFENDNLYFMCIQKEDTFQVDEPEIKPGVTLTDKDFECKPALEAYADKERKYLNSFFNLCRIFKEGNIGYKDLFFCFNHSCFSGIINNILNLNSTIQTRNIIDNRFFSLSFSEVADLNSYITEYSNKPYDLLEECVDEFIWGLEQVDLPTGFEQYTTTLEMILLPKNQSGKKQMLANRVAALLGVNNTEIQNLHQKMINYYRFRSESLHEGDGSNISDNEIKELENITRRILVLCLKQCKQELANSSSVSLDTIKDKIRNDAVNKVRSLQASGIL
jgi:hypothetical protein